MNHAVTFHLIATVNVDGEKVKKKITSIIPNVIYFTRKINRTHTHESMICTLWKQFKNRLYCFSEISNVFESHQISTKMCCKEKTIRICILFEFKFKLVIAVVNNQIIMNCLNFKFCTILFTSQTPPNLSH